MYQPDLAYYTRYKTPINVIVKELCVSHDAINEMTMPIKYHFNGCLIVGKGCEVKK